MPISQILYILILIYFIGRVSRHCANIPDTLHPYSYLLHWQGEYRGGYRISERWGVQLTVKTRLIRAHARDVFTLLDMEMGRCHVEEISHEADSISIVVEFLQCC